MNTQAEQPELIDVDKVMRERKSKALHFFRPLISRYVRRIIHQEEMNAFLKTHHKAQPLDFLHDALFDELQIKAHYRFEENMVPDAEQSYIYIANHPLGGPDGMLLLYTIEKATGKAKVLANDLLMNVKAMREKFLGLNLYGQKSRESVKQMNELFGSDNHVLIFPAGLVSRRQKGVVRDLQWRSFFVKQAVKFNRPVIPVHISGQVSNFFYNFANIRKKIGIKPNIELFYLPNELFKQRGKAITLTFGQAISPSTFSKARTHDQWAASLREFIYDLGAGHTQTFDPEQYPAT